MKLVQAIYPVLGAVLIVLAAVLPVFAAGIVIDGDFGDWAGKAYLVDSGGADDAKGYTDITEFRADATTDGLYLLKAWDDTAFHEASTAGITVRSANNEYYRIYTTAMEKSATVPPKTLLITYCSDATCEEQKTLCEGEGCGKVASGTSWINPFAGRRSPVCMGKDCGEYDTAVELLIPWDQIGGAPQPGQLVFLQFASYPESIVKPYDVIGDKGITCRNTKDNFYCHVSTPTAVTLSTFSARTEPTDVPLPLAMGVLALVSLGMLPLLRAFRARATKNQLLARGG